MGYSTIQGTQGICPSGWHIPTDDEWKTMEMYLDMSQNQANQTGWRGADQGVRLKSTYDWFNNGNGNNISGYTGLPGGSGTPDGVYYKLTKSGYWWGSNELNSTDAWYRLLDYNSDQVYRNTTDMDNGFSIRCVNNQ